MKSFFAALALVVALAVPAFATPGEPNPCGNHGNNCQCETVDTGVAVDTSVVCAAVAEAFSAAFSQSIAESEAFAAAVSKAVSESNSTATSSCEAAQASCEQAQTSSNEATASCGNTSVVCGYTEDVSERLCEKVKYHYNSRGALRSKRCVRWVPGVLVPAVQ